MENLAEKTGVKPAEGPAPPNAAENGEKPDLRDLTPQGVQDLLVEMGEKPFRARQVLQWLYKHAARDYEGMTNLGKPLRQKLRHVSTLRWMEPSLAEESADGTKKLLFELADGNRIESVLIPEEDHSTLCISTQVGCRMGCAFCRTAKLGFSRNLRPSEIMGQILYAREICDESAPLTNLVFMGMGEPLDNTDNLVITLQHILAETGLQMSQRRVTVSTVGRVDQLKALSDASPCALAVSLNAPNDEIRSQIMPINNKFPMSVLRAQLMAYPLKPTRRITLEYVLLKGINDRPEHALELARWCMGLRCKVNLIAFNPHEGSEFEAPDEADVLHFQNLLIENHVTALLRRSRGQDISAACGQLAAEEVHHE